MGSTRARAGQDGSTRYAALYRDLRGRQRSAGTFTTEKQADKAWQRAEALVESGRLGDLRRGRQTFTTTSRQCGCRRIRSKPRPASATPT